jgi:hypothetical protein
VARLDACCRSANLRENLAAEGVGLDDEALRQLDGAPA